MEISQGQGQRQMMDVKLNPSLPFSKMNLLQLPPEILMMIARFLIISYPQQYYYTSLHRFDDVASLFSLSRVHSELRWICIASGLFRRIFPSNTEAFNLADYTSLTRSLFSVGLSSLGINLGYTSLWETCGKVMKRFPDLKELSLSGIIDSTMIKEFCDSELGSSFMQFGGSSLILKHCCFDDSSIRILLKLQRQTITNLVLDQCELNISFRGLIVPGEPMALDWATPLCPNVQVISYSYIGVPDVDGECSLSSMLGFAYIFLQYTSKVQHIQLSYGYRPRLFEDRKLVGIDEERSHDEGDQNENWAHHTSRRMILHILVRYARDSLLSFTEHDELKGPFMESYGWPDDTGIPHWELQTFHKIKLLSFRCPDLYSLTAFDGIDDCTVGYRHCLNDWITLGERKQKQRHSIWYHVSVSYAIFDGCDCIFIEIMNMPKDYRKEVEWCTFASERILGIREAGGLESGSELFRYFIVGNHREGFLGIERDTAMSCYWNENSWFCWPFKSMDEEKCRRVLRQRLYEFW